MALVFTVFADDDECAHVRASLLVTTDSKSAKTERFKMGRSIYHTATEEQAPLCIHAVGIGKAGAGMVEALLRRGGVEDLLEDPRARMSVLVIDIGEQDLEGVRGTAAGFLNRLKERGIPTDRVYLSIQGLEVPERQDLINSLRRFREFQKIEFPRAYWNPNFEPWIGQDIEWPEPGSHVPRSLAKGIYAKAYYDDGTLHREIQAFVRNIEAARLPSIVYTFFSAGGGTGSGIVVDLARHLSNIALGRRVPVVGIGVLPCAGDPELNRSGTLFTTINELDCMIDDAKNAGVMAVWGDLYKNPFTGGLYMVPQDEAWEKLSHYSVAAQRREPLKITVTNRFIDEVVADLVAHDHGRTLLKAARPLGAMASPHMCVPTNERSWNVIAVHKFIHPAVGVMPRQGPAAFRSEIAKWMKRIPEYLPLKKGFKTDYIEVHTYAPREVWNDQLSAQLAGTLSEFLIPGDDSTLRASYGEAFDELTAYSVMLIPGISKCDFTFFPDIREAYDQMSWDDRFHGHSWLVDLGVMLCEPSIRFEGLTGECIWGCACQVVVPHAAIRGEAVEAATRLELWKKAVAPMAELSVKVP